MCFRTCIKVTHILHHQAVAFPFFYASARNEVIFQESGWLILAVHILLISGTRTLFNLAASWILLGRFQRSNQYHIHAMLSNYTNALILPGWYCRDYVESLISDAAWNTHEVSKSVMVYSTTVRVRSFMYSREVNHMTLGTSTRKSSSVPDCPHMRMIFCKHSTISTSISWVDLFL